ncbi:MAG: rod shape-determining protein MreC [Anaerolineae bacterium]|jgi:rod shape-determining protein MreC|nr:rod shape-determining protein MreC [Anaerolineae bacterium]
MIRRRSTNRVTLLILSVLLCIALIFFSGTGALSGLESLLEQPLGALAGVVNGAGRTVETLTTGQRSYEELADYTASLETQLARITSELVALREIGADYQRLADLVNYVSQAQDQEVLAADVIARDTILSLRTLVVNRGVRDGVRVGMPVVTGQGLVGRVINVSANAARVQLITSEFSSVSARTQINRVEGAVVGLASGALRMTLLPQGAQVQVGDLVLTSGIGGNLPPDIVIGQVTSTRQFQSDIEQSAEVRSLIDFDRLEIVLIVTSFEPVDLSVFEPTPAP